MSLVKERKPRIGVSKVVEMVYHSPAHVWASKYFYLAYNLTECNAILVVTAFVSCLRQQPWEHVPWALTARYACFRSCLCYVFQQLIGVHLFPRQIWNKTHHRIVASALHVKLDSVVPKLWCVSSLKIWHGHYHCAYVYKSLEHDARFLCRSTAL